MSEATAALLGPGDALQADRAESDLDDPDLGAAALVDDATGGGGRTDGGSGAGGSEGGGGVEAWPNNDEDEDEPRHAQSSATTGVGPSSGPPAQGGKHKRKQGATLFGSAPKKPKNPAAATRQKETADQGSLVSEAAEGACYGVGVSILPSLLVFFVILV